MGKLRDSTARGVALAVIAALALLRGAEAAADAGTDAVKATFIYNVVRFVDWPEDGAAETRGSLRVCYPRHHPLGAALAGIAGKPVAGRRIEIVPLSAAAGGPPACHVALLADDDIVAGATPVAGLLTVGEIAGVGQAGVAIGLVQVGRLVRFQIDARLAARAGLSISSKLMRLAVLVLR